MKVISVLCLLIVLATGCQKSPNTDSQCGPPKTLIEIGRSDQPMIAIYVEPFDYLNLDVNLISAIWSDGRVIWSENKSQGGPPYFSGNIGNVQLLSFCTDISDQGIFDSPRNSYSIALLNQGITQIIVIQNGEKWLCYISPHELYEKNPRVIFTDRYVIVDPTQSRESMLANCSKEYLQFRDDWKMIQEKVDRLIPNQGQKITDVHFRSVDHLENTDSHTPRISIFDINSIPNLCP